MFRQGCEDGGFSLVEAVVAIGLFSICMLMVAQTVAGIMKANRVAGDCTIALLLAQHKMEEIKISNFSGVINGEEKKLDAAGISGLGKFDRQVQVTDHFTPKHKKVMVKVSWDYDVQHHVVLSSVKVP